VSTPPESDDSLLRALGARVRDERAADRGEPEATFPAALADRITAKILEAPGAPDASNPGASNVVVLSRAGASRPPSGRFFLVMGPLAAAAAILLALALRPSDITLSEYELSVVAAKATRHDPAAAVAETVLDPAGDLELVARPKVAEARVTVRALLVRDGKATPWSAPVDVSKDGAVRIAGPNTTLFDPPRGRAEIVLLLASGARQPSVSEAIEIAEKKVQSGAPVTVVRVAVRFAE